MRALVVPTEPNPMKLFWSKASPYARKVRIVIREHQLLDQIEEVTVDAFTDPPDLLQASPLGRVPVLLLDDGTGLYDSRVICAYLDELGGGGMVPSDPADRLSVMRAQALGDGTMDLAVSLALERRKPEGERTPTFVARWRGQLVRAVDAIAGQLPLLPRSFHLGHAAFASALGYLDFRHPDFNWRDGRPTLAEWYLEVGARPSLATTLPS